MSLFSVMFTYQSIILSSLLVYASDPGFLIPSRFMSYISSVTSSVTSDGLDVDKYDNISCRNNVM